MRALGRGDDRFWDVPTERLQDRDDDASFRGLDGAAQGGSVARMGDDGRRGRHFLRLGERDAERLCDGALQAVSPADPSDRAESGPAAEV
jgi:hypothetical protein